MQNNIIDYPDSIPFVPDNNDSNRCYVTYQRIEKKGIAVDNNDMGSELKRKPMDTIGSLTDKLITVDIKIYMAEDRKREPGATDKQIADDTRLTNKLNTARNQLIAEIDELLGQNNSITIKSYGKTI